MRLRGTNQGRATGLNVGWELAPLSSAEEKDPILGLAANVTAMFILVLGLSGNSANLKSRMNAFV
jgi:hypothetical protein